VLQDTDMKWKYLSNEKSDIIFQPGYFNDNDNIVRIYCYYVIHRDSELLPLNHKSRGCDMMKNEYEIFLQCCHKDCKETLWWPAIDRKSISEPTFGVECPNH